MRNLLETVKEIAADAFASTTVRVVVLCVALGAVPFWALARVAASL